MSASSTTFRPTLEVLEDRWLAAAGAFTAPRRGRCHRPRWRLPPPTVAVTLNVAILATQQGLDR